MDFWTKLKDHINKHHENTRAKIKAGHAYNNIVAKIRTNEITLDDTLKAQLTELKEIHSFIQMTGLHLFTTIVNEIFIYIHDNNLNSQLLENEFRKQNLNIYLIARTVTNDDKNIIDMFTNEPSEYEMVVVVTEIYDYYISELKKYGYTDITMNYKNLLHAGVLIV